MATVNFDLGFSDRILTQLTTLVDCREIHDNYLNASRGLCEGGLTGLVLMLIASFVAAILLTIMVWVDSHTWIYIRKRSDYAQVEEPSYVSHQQQQNHNTISRTQPKNHCGPPAISGAHTLQHPSKRYEMMPQPQHHQMAAHENIRQMGMHTLGRLPSHNHSPSHHAHVLGPNNGKYATLSKQCKTLEANDYY